MIAQQHVVQLGTFECTSGKLVVSDPCYTLGTWCMGEVDALKGTWTAEVVTSEVEDWGNRVLSLKAAHVDHQYRGCNQRADFEVGVDSGQAGIFDKSIYQKDEMVPRNFKHEGDIICRDEPWYSYVSDFTLREGCGAGVVHKGVVSRSGLGDGGYECMLFKTPAGLVAGIEIVFIPDENESDEEDDNEDEDDAGYYVSYDDDEDYDDKD